MTGIPVIPGVLLSSRAEPRDLLIPSTDFSTHHVCLPPVTYGDSPGGACGSASLRRHLHCFGFPAGNLADAPVRP